MPSISVRKLYQDNQAKLSLAWSAGTAGADNRIGWVLWLGLLAHYSGG